MMMMMTNDGHVALLEWDIYIYIYIHTPCEGAFNNLFKSALIDANAHEAEEFKTFAENLAAKMEEK